MKGNKGEHKLTVTTFTIAGIRSYMLWNHKKGKWTLQTQKQALQEYDKHNTKSSHQQMAVLRTCAGRDSEALKLILPYLGLSQNCFNSMKHFKSSNTLAIP